jgi:hypothetical protein
MRGSFVTGLTTTGHAAAFDVEGGVAARRLAEKVTATATEPSQADVAALGN